MLILGGFLHINDEHAAKHDNERNLPTVHHILKNRKARSKRILKEITITVHVKKIGRKHFFYLEQSPTNLERWPVLSWLTAIKYQIYLRK